jgi:NADH-quinone oxidoreductase subunit C
MSIPFSDIESILIHKFGDKVSAFVEIKGIVTFETTPDNLLDVVNFITTEPKLNFHFLTDICGVHLPDNDESCQFAAVYLFHNMVTNTRLRIKVFLDGQKPQITSLTGLFGAANWMERETYDFFGIEFIGHPNMVRILNMDEMTVFPLRKEYPLEDAGRNDKDDRFFGRSIHNES